ncbi:MAG TPA: YjjG family noncanonical pyrimidine nucleotidase [Saprospiraceae bacterium]|nr:YjjG family noncanonical pyrimidine nucleotidase [Saprospiraceae bacterium]
MKKYTWALFDADHTLFDFDKASEEALSEVLAEHGYAWGEGMYADYKRINVQCWMEHEQGLINRDTLVYERFKRYFEFRALELDPVSTQKEYLRRLGTKPYLMPGAEALLTQLQGKIKLGYITNGMTEVQRPRMEKIGWHLRFDRIIIAGEIGHSKPHRAYFEYVHQAIGEPEHHDVLVIGDSLSADIEGALAFGYHTCWYNPDHQLCGLRQGPEYTVSHLDEIHDILLRMPASS